MYGQSTAWPAFICSFLLALIYYQSIRLKLFEGREFHGFLLAFSFVGFNFLISWLYDDRLAELEKKYRRESNLKRYVKGWIIIVICSLSAIGFFVLLSVIGKPYR